MSDKFFSQFIDFQLESSLQKVLLLVVPHFMVASLICLLWPKLNTLSVLFVFVALIITFFSGIYFWRLHISQSTSRSIVSVRNDSNSNWILTLVGGKQEVVVLLPSSFVSSIVVLLIFQSLDNKKYVAFITRDSLSANTFRRLKVRLKHSQIEDI